MCGSRARVFRWVLPSLSNSSHYILLRSHTSQASMKLHIDVELGPDEVGLATELLNTLRYVR